MPGAIRARRGAVIFDDLRGIQLRYAFCQKRSLRPFTTHPNAALSNPQRGEFLSPFSSGRRAKAEIRVCADMSCHLNGACELRADLERDSRTGAPKTCRFAMYRVSGVAIMLPQSRLTINLHGRHGGACEQMARGAMRGEIFRSRARKQARIACKADPYGESEKYGVVRNWWNPKIGIAFLHN